MTRPLACCSYLLCGLTVVSLNGDPIVGAQSGGRPEVPLSVVSVSPDPTTDKVTFTLRNDSDKPVTAWHVRYVDAAGTTEAGGFGVDAFNSYAAGNSNRRGPVYFMEPRSTVSATIDLPRGVDNVVITPVLAVWADKTFTGSTSEAEQIFARRAAMRDAWNVAVVELEAATKAAGMTPAGLRRAIEALETASATNQSGVLRNVRLTLSHALDEVTDGRASAPTRLASLVQHARDNLARATAHSR
jgi:hypothetical protein